MQFSRRSFVGLAASMMGALRFAKGSGFAPGAAAIPGKAPGDLSIWFDKPATLWHDGLMVGNGRLGGMVLGGVKSERIGLNEDTLWSGAPSDWNNPGAQAALPAVRKLVLEDKDYHGADKECHKMMGPWNQAYEPVGDLILDFDHGTETTAYRRELNLDEAVARVAYEVDGVRYERETIASMPDNVIAVWLTASQPGALTLTVKLTSLLQAKSEAEGTKIVLSGKAPSNSPPSYLGDDYPVKYSDESGKGMHFAAVLDAHADGGHTAANPDGSLRIEKANSVLLLVGAATGYRGFSVAPAGPLPEVVAAAGKAVDAAHGKPFSLLKQRQMEDHRKLFRRVSLELGPATGSSAAATMPTDKRVLAFVDAPDPSLLALIFHLGRYLLISASRPGSQPATLQGIWNAEVRPPWSCNWTTNINVQMNYWGAETLNLSECALPLVEMIRDLSVNGTKTATVNYGAPGWVSHHNVDLWRQSAPAGGFGVAWALPTWANYAMSGPWLCSHLWEHYAFTGDIEYLRTTAYPVMKGCAEFCLDWLIPDGKGGLTTCPSVSTENVFKAPADGKAADVSAGCTHDIAVIHEIFKNCSEACRILGVDPTFREKLDAKIQELPPYKIGQWGQLQEWSVDFDEAEPGMRHMSHLYPVFPGSQITPTQTPELARAARASLERRLKFAAVQGTFTGWGRCWAIALWARLADGDMAWESLKVFVNHSMNGNLLDDCNDTNPKSVARTTTLNPDFLLQMDANFGTPAAIGEMLLQSHEPEIAILPAWPAAWTEGKVTGLKARGGPEVDIAWSSLNGAEVTVRKAAGTFVFKAPKGQVFAQATRDVKGRPVPLSLPAGDRKRFTLNAQAGETYRFTVAQA